MRIALVIPQFRAGGAERVMSIMAERLSRSHEVHLIFHIVHEPFYSIPDTVSVHCVDTIRPHASLGAKIVACFTGVFRLRKLFKAIRPDAIVSFHHYRYDQLAILAKAFLRIPIVVSDRSNPLRYGGFSGLLRRAIYHFVDAIVVQTDYAREYYEHHFPGKRVVKIANPVSVFASCVSAKEPLILTVGRLISDKGQGYLIQAFAGLDTDGWRLGIVGDGPLSQELHDLAVRLNVADRVAFPGVVKDVGGYLTKASVFVLPSLREGFPNALVEAMAAGIPCISFNCSPALSELITDGVNGFLVKPRDVADLTRKLRCLTRNEELRRTLGHEASRVGMCFAEGPIVAEWERLFESICC